MWYAQLLSSCGVILATTLVLLTIIDRVNSSIGVF